MTVIQTENPAYVSSKVNRTSLSTQITTKLTSIVTETTQTTSVTSKATNSCPKSFQVSGFPGLNGLYSLTGQTSSNKPVWYNSNTDYYLYWRYDKSIQQTHWVFGKKVNLSYFGYN